VLGLMMGCISQTASANDVGLTQQFSICIDRSNGVTAEMLDCIGAETKRQDVRLNKAYKDVMASLTPARKKQLQEVQRVWIKYRDVNCNFYADPDGGTLAALSSHDCSVMTASCRRQHLGHKSWKDSSNNPPI